MYSNVPGSRFLHHGAELAAPSATPQKGRPARLGSGIPALHNPRRRPHATPKRSPAICCLCCPTGCSPRGRQSGRRARRPVRCSREEPGVPLDSLQVEPARVVDQDAADQILARIGDGHVRREGVLSVQHTRQHLRRQRQGHALIALAVGGGTVPAEAWRSQRHRASLASAGLGPRHSAHHTSSPPFRRKLSPPAHDSELLPCTEPPVLLARKGQLHAKQRQQQRSRLLTPALLVLSERRQAAAPASKAQRALHFPCHTEPAKRVYPRPGAARTACQGPAERAPTQTAWCTAARRTTTHRRQRRCTAALGPLAAPLREWHGMRWDAGIG